MIIAFLIIEFLLVYMHCYFWFRRKRVLKFRLRLINMCAEWSRVELDKIKYGSGNIKEFVSSFDWLYDTIPSFNKMMLSFKPLKLDNWVEKEKLKKLFENL